MATHSLKNKFYETNQRSLGKTLTQANYNRRRRSRRMDDVNCQHPWNNCRDTLISPLIEIQEQIMDEGAWINPETNSVWICSKTNLATDMAIAENLKKEDLTDKQIVPLEYHGYLDIFDEKQAS